MEVRGRNKIKDFLRSGDAKARKLLPDGWRIPKERVGTALLTSETTTGQWISCPVIELYSILAGMIIAL